MDYNLGDIRDCVYLAYLYVDKQSSKKDVRKSVLHEDNSRISIYVSHLIFFRLKGGFINT